MSPDAPKSIISTVKTRLAVSRSFAWTLAMAVLAASVPSSAATQVEISASAGYTFTEGVSLDRALLESIDKIGPANGAAFVASVNFWANRQTQIGFQFGMQDSGLEVNGTAAREVTGMNVFNYHGTATFHAGTSRSQLRPFFMVGLGATHYLPSDMNGQSFDGEFQFSGTMGVGVKAYLNDGFGLTFGARWTPTYIKSDPAGLYCSPYWGPYYPGGCVVASDADYSNQYELSAGVIFRL